MSIEELYNYVAKKYEIDAVFDFIKNEKREISYYKISGKEDFVLESGNINEATEAKLKTEIRGIYGFYLDSESAKNKGYSGNPFILFGLRDSLIPDDNKSISTETKLICLHELCHLIDMRNYQKKLNIEFNKEDSEIGKLVDKFAKEVADRFNGIPEDKYHDEKFGSLLYNLIRRKFENHNAKMIKIALSETLPGYNFKQFVLESSTN